MATAITLQQTYSQPLYVIDLQHTRSQPDRPLTPQDRVEGWSSTTDWDDQPCLVNEGHQRGQLRSLTGPHILTWSVHPGQTIRAVLRVEFTQRLHVERETAGDDSDDGPNGIGSQILSATCKPEHRVRDTDSQSSGSLLVRCETVLGRSVSLGEDGAEDAYGGDAIHDQIAAAVLDGDWRDSQCALTLVDCPYDQIEGDTLCQPGPLVTAHYARIKAARITVELPADRQHWRTPRENPD